MRTLLLFGLTLLVSCGGSQKKQCFECGLSEEWARAEAAERERANATDAEVTEPVEDEEYHGCGIPSTAENPDPCGSTAGQIIRYGPPEDDAGQDVLGEPFDHDPTPSAGSPLEQLSVRAPVLDGYNRKDWKHWSDEDHDCQDTRQEVLIEESEVPVTFKTERKCKVLTGQWTCPYTGEVFTNPRKLDVGPLIPLAAAHAAGGHAWDTERKRAFANELGVAHHLIAVKAGANRSKGKRGPEEWLPDVDAYRCEYVRAWIDIKVEWKLAASAAEKVMLEEFSSRCSASSHLLEQHENILNKLCACKDMTCVENLEGATPEHYADGLEKLVGEERKQFESLNRRGRECIRRASAAHEGTGHAH